MKNNLDKYQILFDKIKTIDFEKISVDEAVELSNEINEFSGNKKTNLLLCILDKLDGYTIMTTKTPNKALEYFFTEDVVNDLAVALNLVDAMDFSNSERDSWGWVIGGEYLDID